MTDQPQRSGADRGILYAIAAYAMWGLAPLYWPHMYPAGAVEILAHRMTWSLAVLAIINAMRGTWGAIAAVLKNARLMRLLTFAALLITLNWGLYIWAVVNKHVIDASLGYFINPLVNVAFGIAVFGERLRKLQWVAVAIAAIGVITLAIDTHEIPWIGLVLGLTFGAYGMVKKVADVDAVESLTIETILLVPFSASYLVYLAVTGDLAFGHHGPVQAGFSLFAGAFTAIPLLAFGAAAVRIPYSTMGIIQYGSPTLQFLLGWLVNHEVMSTGRWLGFGIVWAGLVVFGIDALRSGRNIATSEE